MWCSLCRTDDDEKIDYKNYTFEVMAIEERRISKVKVTVHEKKYVKEEEKD